MKSEFFAPVLVELLDAAYQQDYSALTELEQRVQAYYLSLVVRFESNVPLLAALPEYEDLQRELEEFFPRYSSALKGLLGVNSSLSTEDVDELCCRCHRMELHLREIQERCQVLESELPELLGHPLLNEILILSLHRLHGHLEGLPGLAPRLAGLMEFLNDAERARSDFFSRFREPELEEELVSGLTQLKEASGGLFVVLQGEGSEVELSQAAELLQRGANMAVLCLAQMQELESRESSFSEDPLLERLYQSRECEETADGFLQKLRAREAESAKGFHFLSEQRLYPSPYPAEELYLLREKRAILESSLAELSFPASGETLERLREQFIAYDRSVDRVQKLLKTDFLPEEAAVFRHYLELLQNVSSGRAPLYLLSLHTEGLWNSLEEFWEHLEREDAEQDLFLSLGEVRDAFNEIETFLEDGERGRLQQAYGFLFSSARALAKVAQAPRNLEQKGSARSSSRPLDIVADMQKGNLEVSDGRRQLSQALNRQEKSILRLRELSAALLTPELGALWEELEIGLRELRELLQTDLDNNLLLGLELALRDYLALLPQVQESLTECSLEEGLPAGS